MLRVRARTVLLLLGIAHDRERHPMFYVVASDGRRAVATGMSPHLNISSSNAAVVLRFFNFGVYLVYIFS